MIMGKALLRGGVLMTALLSASVAGAEVRLEYSGGTTYDVVIVPTWRGPWTPTGNVTPLVLNPSGDLSGDSMPGWDGNDEVLAAWIRPGSQTIEKATGSAQGWSQLAPWPAEGAIGQPIVDLVSGGWGVTWQTQDSSGLHVTCGGIGLQGGEAVPQVVVDGHLVGTWALDGELWIITSAEGGQGLHLTHVVFAFVPTQPLPISAVFSQGPVGMLVTPLEGADVRMHGVSGANGQSLLVLTWWKGPRTLAWVVVANAGVAQGQREMSATSGWHPDRLVDAARRDAAKVR
jgi:hypothetical protein